jgi:methyl coenzyme M reductase beta subunit
MATASALDRFLDPVAACFTPQVAERIAGLRLDPDLVARIEFLAEKANEGTLTAEEDDEYKDYVEGGDMLALLQAKARRFLRQHGQ